MQAKEVSKQEAYRACCRDSEGHSETAVYWQLQDTHRLLPVT